MLFLKQPLVLPFMCHKTAITAQNDSNEVLNFKLKPTPCSDVKIGTLWGCAKNSGACKILGRE